MCVRFQDRGLTQPLEIGTLPEKRRPIKVPDGRTRQYSAQLTTDHAASRAAAPRFLRVPTRHEHRSSRLTE